MLLNDCSQYLFFIATPLQFEAITLKELQSLKIHLNLSSIIEETSKKGGIELRAQLADIWPLIAHLKTVSHISIEIDQFKCRDFPKLYNKLKKINWSQFGIEGIPILKISSKESRLFHTKRIEQTAKKFFEKEFNKPQELVLHLDFYQDICRVKIRLTPDQHFKHGFINPNINSRASLRETYAAACLLFLDQIYQDFFKKKMDTLIDITCGRGTLLTEALNWGDPLIRVNPFTKEQIKTICKIESMATNFIGFDQDKKIIDKLQNGEIRFYHQDATKPFPQTIKKQIDASCAILFNPPYGKRIAQDYRLTQDIFNNCIKELSPNMILAIIPRHFKLVEIEGYQFIPRQLNFSNNGLNVKLFGYYKLNSSQ